MKYAKPVSDFARYISDFDGLSVLVNFRPNQKWKLSRCQGYCYLTRRGCFQVRLSERTFNKLFEVIEE